MSRLQQTARLFRRNRGRWLSAVGLVKAGGLLAWRTRVSECRTLLGMQVEQETRKGRSFYRYTGRKAA
jgi:hypothetical protein